MFTLVNIRSASPSFAGQFSAGVNNEQSARILAERRVEVTDTRLEVTKQALAASQVESAALQQRLRESEGYAVRAAAAEASVMELRSRLADQQRHFDQSSTPVQGMDACKVGTYGRDTSLSAEVPRSQGASS